jgi:hypothetical protein
MISESNDLLPSSATESSAVLPEQESVLANVLDLGVREAAQLRNYPTQAKTGRDWTTRPKKGIHVYLIGTPHFPEFGRITGIRGKQVRKPRWREGED